MFAKLIFHNHMISCTAVRESCILWVRSQAGFMHCEILVYFLSFHEFVTIFIDICSTSFVSVQNLMQAYLLQPGMHYVHTVPKSSQQLFVHSNNLAIIYISMSNSFNLHNNVRHKMVYFHSKFNSFLVIFP